MTASPQAMLRFGSLQGRLWSAQQYIDALSLVFGVELRPAGADPGDERGSEQREAPGAGHQFDLHIACRTSPVGGSVGASRHVSHITLAGTPLQPTIATDALHAQLQLDHAPVNIRITVLSDQTSFDALCVHFVVIIHKILFLLDRVILHAAAVELDGQVSIFMGEKGAGKSTTCLALARAGGVVLGEDQLILRRLDGRYSVSGGDERSRVTEGTERHFFAKPLAVPARDFAGTMKKEIRMGDFFRSEPFRDFPAHRLIFPRVTTRFELRRIKARPALLRLMAYNGHFQRFEGARDQATFLDFLADFVATVSCWELDLSTDLTELDGFAEKLRHA